jgi:hypothetical protein
MATSLTLENDSSLAQGYIKVNGSTAATLTTSGITGNLTGNADTATKFSTTTGSAPAYACRAWVNFDGTRDSSGAVSSANTNRFIRSSGNVTSVLRNGTGDYTVNFTTAMADANYSVSGMSNQNSSFLGCLVGLSMTVPPTTSTVRITTGDRTTGVYDAPFICVAIFGN